MNIAMGTTPVIAIVVPCYNEEQALPLSVPKMLDVIDRMVADGIASAESYVLLLGAEQTIASYKPKLAICAMTAAKTAHGMWFSGCIWPTNVSKAYPWHITEAINMCFWRG